MIPAELLARTHSRTHSLSPGAGTLAPSERDGPARLVPGPAWVAGGRAFHTWVLRGVLVLLVPCYVVHLKRLVWLRRKCTRFFWMCHRDNYSSCCEGVRMFFCEREGPTHKKCMACFPMGRGAGGTSWSRQGAWSQTLRARPGMIQIAPGCYRTHQDGSVDARPFSTVQAAICARE